jgi:hypothetical protein
VKRGDTYRPEKLKASIKAAGASSEVAKKALSSARVHKGMSSLELRKQVSDLLKNLDPKAARKHITSSPLAHSFFSHPDYPHVWHLREAQSR